MHNSLYIRDMLRTMNANPLVRERRDPHRGVSRDAAARPGSGEVELTGVWAVTSSVAPQADGYLVDDLQDFLQKMGVILQPGATHRIQLTLDPTLSERDFTLQIKPGNLIVQAGGISGAWAAAAWLELEMRSRRGPFLPVGLQRRKAGWGTQISQGPWGGNYSVPDFSPDYLSDDCFRLYAHYGVNSMMIYGDLLCYVESQVLPELNHPEARQNLAVLQDAARRAAAYGVQFTYVPVGPKLHADHPVFTSHPQACGTGTAEDGFYFLCSGDAQVLDFYREFFGGLFRAVPQLAGLILIVAEESFYHCKARERVQSPCPRCTPLPTEEALANLLDPIQQSVHEANPSVFVAAWPYTTNQWEHPDRVPFIQQMPEGISFFLPIEKDQEYRKDGYIKRVWDYSIDYTGPSEHILLTAEACKQVRRPLFVKTETGIGLEVTQFPYVPAMQRLAEKWQHVRDLAPVGVHQSWLFYGMFGSRAEALGLWAAYAPELLTEEFLTQLARADFGADAASLVVDCWQSISDTMGRLPVILFNTYYTGPSFLGPCHPLVPVKGMRLSPVFDAALFYLQELGESFSHKNVDELRHCLAVDEINPEGGLPEPLPGEERTEMQIFLNEYELAEKAAKRGWEKLLEAKPYLRTESDWLHFREESLLVELVYRTVLACSHTAQFITARDRGDTLAMRRIAVAEKENTLAARPIYLQAPWLDYPMRIDGLFSPAVEMIDEKVRMLDAFLGE